MNLFFFSVEETVNPKVFRRREQKWLDMFDQWPLFIESRFDKLKNRCRKGIPASLRGLAWSYLSAAKYRQENENRKSSVGNIFSFYLTQPINARVLDDINKDLTRSFPDHEMFRGNGCGYVHSKKKLFISLIFTFLDNEVYLIFLKLMQYMIQLLVIVKHKHR
jgi:hypothetical protein